MQALCTCSVACEGHTPALSLHNLSKTVTVCLFVCTCAENGPADLTQNRYIYLRKLSGGKFATEYAFGPSITYTIAKQHVLANGQKMPLWAKLETPQVNSVLSVDCSETFSNSGLGSACEPAGAAANRSGSCCSLPGWQNPPRS